MKKIEKLREDEAGILPLVPLLIVAMIAFFVFIIIFYFIGGMLMAGILVLGGIAVIALPQLKVLGERRWFFGIGLICAGIAVYFMEKML